MITLVEAVPLLSLPAADRQSPKALTGNFGQLLSAAQDATSVADGHTPEALEALESVLQTLAHILQPLTLSLEPASSVPGSTDKPEASLSGSGSVPNGAPPSFVPWLLLTASPGAAQSPRRTLPLPEEPTQATMAALPLPRSLEPGEAKQKSASAVSAAEEDSPEDPQETASVAVQATLAALLTAPGALWTVATPRPQGAAAGTQTSETQPARGVTPLPVSASDLPIRSRGMDGALPVKTTFPSLLDTDHTPQPESSAPFSALLQTFDGALAPVATRSQPGEVSPAPAGTGFVEPADGEQARDRAPLLASERPPDRQIVFTPSLEETTPTVPSPPDETPAAIGEASYATVLRAATTPDSSAPTAVAAAAAAPGPASLLGAAEDTQASQDAAGLLPISSDTTPPLPAGRPWPNAVAQEFPGPPSAPPAGPPLRLVASSPEVTTPDSSAPTAVAAAAAAPGPASLLGAAEDTRTPQDAAGLLPISSDTTPPLPADRPWPNAAAQELPVPPPAPPAGPPLRLVASSPEVTTPDSSAPTAVAAAAAAPGPASLLGAAEDTRTPQDAAGLLPISSDTTPPLPAGRPWPNAAAQELPGPPPAPPADPPLRLVASSLEVTTPDPSAPTAVAAAAPGPASLLGAAEDTRTPQDAAGLLPISSDATPPLPAGRPWPNAAAQELPVPPPAPPAGPPLQRTPLPDQLPTEPEGLSDIQPPTGTRTRAEDIPEAPPEQTLSALPGTPEAGLFSGGRPVGSTAPRPQDAALPPPPSAQDGPPLSPPWRLPIAANTVLLHINPPEFGPLLVHVRLQDKRLIASFRAESPEIEAILRANLPALHASLSQQGFEVQPITLSLGTDGFSTALNQGSGSSSQQQSTFHAFTQEQPDTDAERRRNDPEPGRLFSESRPYKRRLIDLVV